MSFGTALGWAHNCGSFPASTRPHGLAKPVLLPFDTRAESWSCYSRWKQTSGTVQQLRVYATLKVKRKSPVTGLAVLFHSLTAQPQSCHHTSFVYRCLLVVTRTVLSFCSPLDFSSVLRQTPLASTLNLLSECPQPLTSTESRMVLPLVITTLVPRELGSSTTCSTEGDRTPEMSREEEIWGAREPRLFIPGSCKWIRQLFKAGNSVLSASLSAKAACVRSTPERIVSWQSC